MQGGEGWRCLTPSQPFSYQGAALVWDKTGPCNNNNKMKGEWERIQRQHGVWKQTKCSVSGMRALPGDAGWPVQEEPCVGFVGDGTRRDGGDTVPVSRTV